jgi:hypothetical protein
MPLLSGLHNVISLYRGTIRPLYVIFQRIRSSPRPFVTYLNELYGEQSLASSPTPSWRTTPCRLSATAYSIYPQLPSISGGRLLHPQTEDACNTNGGKRNACKFLVGKPEGRQPLGRPRPRWEESVKMDLREIGWGDMDWIYLAQDRDQ